MEVMITSSEMWLSGRQLQAFYLKI